MPTGVEHTIAKIQRQLRKIDQLRLPERSRRDIESILVQQVVRELDRALPAHAGHGLRTAEIAVLLGQKLMIVNEELHQLKLASYLHDVGLLLMPRAVTKYDGYLDAEAYRTVQNHARLGASLLEPFTFLRAASVFIAHHHERWDGTGYPYGIRGPFIPLGARILAVADAFDAIAVPNVQEQSQRDLIALRILLVASGTQFDPAVVEQFARIMLKQQGQAYLQPSLTILS
jgi:HD-GYP domain-containing protein (c-di-GMP phosphodiesterase class II)